MKTKSFFLSVFLFALPCASCTTKAPTEADSSLAAAGLFQESLGVDQGLASDSSARWSKGSSQGRGFAAYVGEIDGQYPIRAILRQDGERVFGKYFYETVGGELLLSGTFANGQYSLSEYSPQGTQVGSIVLSGLEKLTGKWSSLDARKVYDIWLQPQDDSYSHPKLEAFASRIEEEAFLEYLRNFLWVNALPISFEHIEGMYLSPEAQRAYLDPYSYEEDPNVYFGSEENFAVLCFFVGDHVATVHVAAYSPGMMGISNRYYYLSTYSFSGKRIDQQEIGYDNSDQDMGDNALTLSSSLVKIGSDGQVDVVNSHRYEQLFEDGDPVEETSETTRARFVIAADGTIARRD